MDFSKLSASDKRILVVAAVVSILGLTSIADDWGAGAVIGLLGGLLGLAIILLPQLSPTTKLPVAKGQGLLAAGVVAVIGFVLAALTWLSYALDIANVNNILFDVGLVLSFVLLYFGWQAYQAERPATSAAAPPSAPAEQPPAPPAA